MIGFFFANPVDFTYPANSCNTESGMSKFACTESTSSSSSSKSISAKTCLADDESCKGTICVGRNVKSADRDGTSDASRASLRLLRSAGSHKSAMYHLHQQGLLLHFSRATSIIVSSSIFLSRTMTPFSFRIAMRQIQVPLMTHHSSDNVDLTSEPVLFLLSVSVSIYSATPLGA